MVVNKSKSSWNDPAPGELELVRRFLNTWKVPNDTRVPVDELAGLLREPSAREKRFPGIPFGPEDTEGHLAEMRDDLRGALGGSEGWEELLDRWLRRYPVVARVRSEGGRATAGGLAGRSPRSSATGSAEGETPPASGRHRRARARPYSPECVEKLFGK